MGRTRTQNMNSSVVQGTAILLDNVGCVNVMVYPPDLSENVEWFQYM